MAEVTDLTFGSLFSGIGGLDLGLERAGWHCRWQVEQNDYCREVLTHHWPDVPKFGSIEDVTGDELERVDLIAGGFPCPPFSKAGHRRGILDDRWLWPEFARLLRRVRPRFVLVENVDELARHADAFGRVLADLHELGFDAEWSLVSACSLGAPHTRQRLFVLAYAQGDDGSSYLSRDRAGSRGGLEHRGGGRGAGPERWLPEPGMGRVAHGVPRRLVRPPLEGFGNAVVPQVAELVGRRLMEAA